MPRRRRPGKTASASVPRDKKRVKKPDNPFGAVGSPVTGTIGPDKWDVTLSQEKLDYLADLAKAKPGLRTLVRRPIDCRRWLKRNVPSLARRFLEDAQSPSVRSIRDELYQLLNLLGAAIRRCEQSFRDVPDDWPQTLSAFKKHIPPRCDDVADCVEQLTPQALSEITRRGAVSVPPVEELRRGDSEALHTLYGLVPLDLDPNGLVPVDLAPMSASGRWAYTGVGSHELTQIGRPNTVRIERFAWQLCRAYHGATGRLPGGGEGSPFMAFFVALMSELRGTDKKYFGVKACKRAVKAYNALIAKANT